MLEKLKNSIIKLWKRWKWRHIRRRQKAWGVPEPTEGPSFRPSSELAHTASFSGPAGGICTKEEKLDGVLKDWDTKRHDVKDLLVPDAIDLQKEFEEIKKNAAAAGDED